MKNSTSKRPRPVWEIVFVNIGTEKEEHHLLLDLWKKDQAFRLADEVHHLQGDYEIWIADPEELYKKGFKIGLAPDEVWLTGYSIVETLVPTIEGR